MSNEHEEQVAGVTLWFKDSALMKPHFSNESYRVELRLDCAVVDEEIWRAVETKFKQGLRVFTSSDFHVEVLEVVRQDMGGLKARLAEAERALRQEQDRRQQLEVELEKYKEPFAAFGRALQGGRGG